MVPIVNPVLQSTIVLGVLVLLHTYIYSLAPDFLGFTDDGRSEVISPSDPRTEEYNNTHEYRTGVQIRRRGTARDHHELDRDD